MSSISCLIVHFTKKTEELKTLMCLRGENGTAEEWIEILKEMEHRVTSLESKFYRMRDIVDKEEVNLNQAKKMFEGIKIQKEEIDQIQSYLPQEIKSKLEESLKNTNHIEQGIDEKIPDEKNSQPQQQASINTSIMNEPKQGQKKSKDPFPTISYLQDSDFVNIPKYMKGRLTLEKINKAIDEIQKIIETKYKLLNTPFSKLSGERLKKYREYKEQETKETKKVFFFMDSDLKNSKEIKFNATGTSVFAVLRHTNRIKEIGGTTKRYVIVV